MNANRYLLDTNILVYILNKKESLTKKVLNIFSDSANLLYTSSLCVAELSHLRKTGKVKLADKSIFKHAPNSKGANAYGVLVREVEKIGDKERKRTADLSR